MGCTSSKENTNPLVDQDDQLISEQFRKWLKTNRTQADEYILNEIRSTKNPDDYRVVVNKAFDLLTERSDIKTIPKLHKLLQKEVSPTSTNQISHTMEIFQQTAEKLRQGQIQFEKNIPLATIDGELTKPLETKGMTSSEGGVALKEVLEKARILFYKGKQAAIFANPNGGYDVRIIDENDDALQKDGNLLRSIIVTEVKMRPKSTPLPSPPSTIPPPPPPSAKLLDEREIGDDFRRSIDAALKGLEAIYQTTPMTSSENANISQIDIQPKLVDEIMVETIETTSASQIEDSVPSHQVQQRIKEHLSNQSTPEKNPLATDIQSKSLDSSDRIPPKPSRSFEEHRKIHSPSDMNLMTKSPSHNVTYTEIIQSESRDGEQSRRFVTESYDDLPTKDDEQSTSFKVVTKSEFSKDPTSGEKIMEQSVQIITVKVRNETSTTTNNPSPIADQNHSADKHSLLQ